MTNTYTTMCLVIVLFPCFAIAQITGFTEDFNDNILTGWEVPADQAHTFELAEEDSMLEITYHRTAQSWEWDNFNFTPPQEIDVSNNPYISVKAKSNILTVLTFKPIYTDLTDDWIQVTLPSDGQWHTYLFDLTTGGTAPMNRIYMYLDGGTTVPKSGTVYFDDLKIGDDAEILIDITELGMALTHAQNLYNSSDEGTAEGQFVVGTKAVLQNAIDEAQAVYDLPNPTGEEIETAIWELYDACVDFEIGVVVNISVIDPLATKKTKYLYANLDFLSEDFLLFGMHDATGYGVGWSGDNDRSDVKDVCGSYPAVYSWDANVIARGLDVTSLKYRMTASFDRGGIQTLCWHQRDPLNRGFYIEDVNYENIVATILPGGQYHDVYKDKLLRLAKFLKSLRGADGHSIPVIFRPYHEHDGGWFWWGAGNCSTLEYNSIWQFTVTYLRDSLNVHNLLYVISPSKHDSRETYLTIFPGDEYIDSYGMDAYFNSTVYTHDKQVFLNRLRVVAELANERFKLAALTEVGQETIPTANWFTGVLLDPLKNDVIANKISYAAVWRNDRIDHHYAPYPGHPSVPDFLQFYNDPYTLFEDDLPDMYALTSEDSIAPTFTQLPEPNFIAFDTLVVLEVETNERAFLRYSTIDQSYDDMPYEFESGQGQTIHSTTVSGKQGQQYEYYIRAVDYFGNKTPTSAIISFKVDTLLAPVNWYDQKYNNALWNTGIAPLGCGCTVTTAITNVRTVYFRHEFDVTDASSITYLAAILKYDNGAVIYLNGEEIERVNMPPGTITYDSWADLATNGIKAITFDANDINQLKNGTNVLAVELHQHYADTSDMLFDLRLITPNPLIEFGSSWFYYDAGDEPDQQIISDVADEHQSNVPYSFHLFQNYPNPFNPETVVRYTISSLCNVELKIYDVLGKEMATVVNNRQQAGSYTVRFHASKLASGIYLYRLKAGNRIITKKMILIH